MIPSGTIVIEATIGVGLCTGIFAPRQSCSFRSCSGLCSRPEPQEGAQRHGTGVPQPKRRTVRAPVSKATSKRLCRHISQTCCPWNVKFSQELTEASPFRARESIAGKDSLTLARDILALDQDAVSAVFRKSPMKRAKLAGFRRNAAVVLDNLRD